MIPLTPALPNEPNGWRLAPEGAAIHVAGRVLVVADVHLGYEWARARGGDMVPPHSLAETVGKLGRALDRAEAAGVAVDRLVVAGDLVETRAFCRRTAADVRRLRAWVAERGLEFVALRGNHDPPWVSESATLEVEGWTIGHGDRPLRGDRLVFGHHHPSLRAGGVAAPCFLAGPKMIALPAFSPNAAGFDIVAAGLPEVFRGGAIRVFAGLDDTLLDFGPLPELRARLGPRGRA